jgi:transcriptional regulator with XRE-family HTH domain
VRLVPKPEEDTEADFGRGLAKARRDAGLSQAELAQRLSDELGIKVDQTAISRIEGGTRSVRLGEAVALVSVLSPLMRVDNFINMGRVYTPTQLAEDKLEALEFLRTEVAAAVKVARQQLKDAKAGRSAGLSRYDEWIEMAESLRRRREAHEYAEKVKKEHGSR